MATRNGPAGFSERPKSGTAPHWRIAHQRIAQRRIVHCSRSASSLPAKRQPTVVRGVTCLLLIADELTHRDKRRDGSTTSHACNNGRLAPDYQRLTARSVSPTRIVTSLLPDFTHVSQIS